ncbi:YitT family protein [Flavisphingomonas formosensis]|uniref:YitT family protein n=1 Tax=Flavisphingomonas formosensis TaxID=861534 RepID=UPI0012FC131D|nr:YitT family protein [Sphingomonas formosensis]
MGASFAAFGLVMLKAAGLVTAGVAGIALVLSYATAWPIGPLFVAINLPFFLVAQRSMGVTFTIKSLGAMVLLAALARFMPLWLHLGSVQPAFAAVFGGSLIGMGVLSLARHKASVGGIGIVSLLLQDRRGWNAGLTQMMFDVVIIGVALPIVGIVKVGYSILSAVALNGVMFAYHRPGRYFGY